MCVCVCVSCGECEYKKFYWLVLQNQLLRVTSKKIKDKTIFFVLVFAAPKNYMTLCSLQCPLVTAHAVIALRLHSVFTGPHVQLDP